MKSLFIFGLMSLSIAMSPSTLAIDLGNTSCRLRFANAGTDEGFCSCSVIGPTQVLTNAHCVTEMGLRISSANGQGAAYVQTSDGRKQKIVNQYVDQEYFGRATVYDSLGRLELLGITSSLRDIGIVIVEKEIASTFPEIEFEKITPSDLRTCRFLGYSPKYCDENNPSSCIRSFSPKKITEKALVPPNPANLFYYGDSGSGVFCVLGDQNSEKLVSVVATMGIKSMMLKDEPENSTLLLSNFRNFLEAILNPQTNARIKPLIFSPNYREEDFGARLERLFPRKY